MRNVGVLLDIPIDRRDLRAIELDVTAALDRNDQPLVFACANPHSLVCAQSDPLFKTALQGADLVVVDGVGVAVMAKLAGIKVGPRITGSDYFRCVMQVLDRRDGKVFLFGSTERVLDLMVARMQRDFPHVAVCGLCSPPFGEWSKSDNADMVAKINTAKPDVLWVGMTAPKQEKWVEQNKHGLKNIRVIGSIGAVFDFYAGTTPRAPRVMCALGIEWLYRLAREPGRMWRRTFVSTPRFVGLVVMRHVVHGRVPRAAARVK